MPQAGQEATSTDKPITETECPKNMSEAGYKCVCLNARSIVNKKNELNTMVVDIDPHIIGITKTKMITQNAIKEVSKGECIKIRYFNHGHIQWKSLESTGGEDQQFLFLIQESFLIQHVLEPTRGENVLYIVLPSQKGLVDNVKNT